MNLVESEVLAEYAAMAEHLAQLAHHAQVLSNTQPVLLAQLRPLERKLGLVLTLFKGAPSREGQR